MTRGALRRRAILAFVIMATVQTGVLFLVVLVGRDTARLPEVLGDTGWLWFLPVPLLVPIFYLAHALRLSVALKRVGAPVPAVRSLAACILSGNLANVALPAAGGELVLAYLGSRFHSVSMPHMLASSTFTKAVGLATNAALALLGLVLLPAPEAGGSEVSFSRLFNTAVAVLLGVLVAALAFPRLLNVGSRIMRLAFRVEQGPEAASKWRMLAAKVSNGVDRTAEHFAALRRMDLGTAARLVGATLVINIAFCCVLSLGFLAVGHLPPFHQILLFNSILSIVLISTMFFMGALGTMEVTTVAYWSQATGLGVSEIVVVLLAVRLWQFVEMGTAMCIFYRYLSRLTGQETKELLDHRQPPSPGLP